MDHRDVALWLCLAVAAGPGLAAGTLGRATRPPLDTTAPIIDSPMGPSQPALVAGFLSGPLGAALGGLPLLVAVALSAARWWVVGAQLVVSGLVLAGVVAWATRTRRAVAAPG